MSSFLESRGTPKSDDPDIEAARQNFERQKSIHSNKPPAAKEGFMQRIERVLFGQEAAAEYGQATVTDKAKKLVRDR